MWLDLLPLPPNSRLNKAGVVDTLLMDYRFNPKSITNHNTVLSPRMTDSWCSGIPRKDIVSAMRINPPVLRIKMCVAYGKILMDLCLTNNKRILFVFVAYTISKNVSDEVNYHNRQFQ